MVIKRVRPRSRNLNITKTRQIMPRSPRRGILDRTVSVRSIVKFSAIILAFIVVLSLVFLLGRITAKNAAVDPLTDSEEKTIQTYAEEPTDISEKGDVSTEITLLNDTPEEVIDIPDTPDETEENTEEDKQENAYHAAEEEVCEIKPAGFEYEYQDIDVKIASVKTEKKGEDWATMTSLRLSITNNDNNCTSITPARIMIKLVNKGKAASWWDDDLYLPQTFRDIKPGQTATDTIDIHVSFADLDEEKELYIAILDPYDGIIDKYSEYMYMDT